VTVDGHRLEQYFVLGANLPTVPSSDEACEDEFGALFERSVQCRLVPGEAVAVLLSGGIDSAAVACEATRLAPVTSTRVHAVSAVFDDTPSADEREYIAPVLSFRPTMTTTRIVADQCWGFRTAGQERGRLVDEPGIDSLRGLLQRLFEGAKHAGAGTVLSGLWADQVMTSDAYWRPELLWDVPPVAWPSEWGHFRGRRRFGSFGVAARVFGIPVWRWIRRRNRQPDRFASRWARGGLVARELMGGTMAARLSTLTNTAAAVGVEPVFPFLDRRLVEFLMALPAQQVFRQGLNKSILRRGLKHRLPVEAQVRRASHGHFSDLDSAGFGREFERLAAWQTDAALVRAGVLSTGETQAIWARTSPDTAGRDRRVTGWIMAEAWLRTHDLSGT
jgi:asparagine synthetase B (glutamine-hydrolysing)